ncbi:hypothetical protein [Guggenheimella bovis]
MEKNTLLHTLEQVLALDESMKKIHETTEEDLTNLREREEGQVPAFRRAQFQQLEDELKELEEKSLAKQNNEVERLESVLKERLSSLKICFDKGRRDIIQSVVAEIQGGDF